MPEVRLGINPGAGGTQRLPRLIGAEAALKMLLTAETINAEKALQLGLIDAISPVEDFIQSADKPARTSLKTDHLELNQTAFDNAEKIIKKTRPEIIAPQKILEAVKTGLTESFQAGLEKEQHIFAECMDTLPTRNKIYLFFATKETSKAPDLADVKPAKITTAAVVGMGSMGTGIAHALIIAGLPVIVRDENTAALDKGTAKIKKSLEKRVASGKLSPQRAEQMLALITTTTKSSDIAHADIVIEAVFETVPVKRAVLAEIENNCRPETIIATNTSTLSLDDLAAKMTHPDRLVGLHFFNPAQVMPLVEVIRTHTTSPKTIATALQLTKQIRKTPVLVNNREGFLVNRIFIPYLKEAFYLLEDGADPRAIDAAAVDFGFPMGPLTLIDMAGLDILAFTDEVMRKAFHHHKPESDVLSQLVEKGLLGQKTGSGLYKYQKGDYTPHDNPEAQKIIANVRKKKAKQPAEIDKDAITERLVLRMVNEALYVMDEKIAQRQSDLDVAMVLGLGFPDFRGGLLKYANDLGIENVKKRLEALADQFGPRFQPPT
jgi:3-hydroxyacyl-CoA dehydrogenase